ncbi:MAG: hypothetical protein WA987_09000 [Cellvibrio sp.]
MNLKDVKVPSGAQAVASFAVVAMLWSGGQIAAVPDRLQALETKAELLAHRVGELEKTVRRENQTLATK